jgi:hypothetical protein
VARWCERRANSSCSSRDVEALGDVLRRLAHPDVDLRELLHGLRVARRVVPAHRDHRHRLGAACNGDIDRSRHDALGGDADRLDTGRAEAVDGHARDLMGKPGEETGDAGHVHALLGLRERAAEDDILDLVLVEFRGLLHDGLDGVSRHVVGPRVPHLSFVGLPERRPGVRYDCDVSLWHVVLLVSSV